MGGRVETTPMDTNLWSNLPRELLHQVFAHLPISRIYNLRVLSHEWMKEVYNEESRFNRFLVEVPNPTKLGRISRGLEKSHWAMASLGTTFLGTPTMPSPHFNVYDLKIRRRKRNLIEIPLKYSGPAFDADGGLVCLFNYTGYSEMIVLNPLTKLMRQLPPLLSRSPPVLIKLKVNRKSKQYRLFVVVHNPNDRSNRDSVITQVYSSQTKEWAIMTSTSEQLSIVGYRYGTCPIVYCVFNCREGRLQDFTISDIVQKDDSIKLGPVCIHQDRMFVMEKDTSRGRFVSYQIGEYKLLENGSGWVQEATHSCDEALQGFNLFPQEDWEMQLGASEGFLFLSVQLTAAASGGTIFQEHFAWLYELSTGDWFEVPVDADGDNIFQPMIFELNSSAKP